MKKLTNRKKGGIFSLLLGNYILFTVILAFVLISLFSYVLLRSYNSVMELDISQIEACDELLGRGAYDEFPTVRLLGEKGFIAVLDEQAHPVYNEGRPTIVLTPGEVGYIPPYEVIGTMFSAELPLANGTVHHQIIREHQASDGVPIIETYILDESYRLLYASGNYIADDLSEKEYLLLTQRYFEGYSVSKYGFQNDVAKDYTLLLFQAAEGNNPVLARLGRAVSDSGLIFLLVYCTMIAGFILWLKRKITSPLYLLCEQLNQFEVGSTNVPAYRGPREFVAIFDSFSAMESRLKDSETKRKKLEADKQSMLTGITHDLKTPITVVQGYTKALSDGIIPPEQQPKYLALVSQKAEELNNLINTFHAYSQLEHPDYQLKRERTDICNYFRDYVADSYFSIEAASFLPTVEIPEKHFYCMVDQAQLRRVLDNLLGNAIKHNPQGTALYFGLQKEESAILLTIADNGIGIPAELTEDIFSPFVMGEVSRKGSGSGLGLSIAQRIVQAHGGSIRLVEAHTGYKTEFIIKLPLE